MLRSQCSHWASDLWHIINIFLSITGVKLISPAVRVGCWCKTMKSVIFQWWLNNQASHEQTQMNACVFLFHERDWFSRFIPYLQVLFISIIISCLLVVLILLFIFSFSCSLALSLQGAWSTSGNRYLTQLDRSDPLLVQEAKNSKITTKATLNNQINAGRHLHEAGRRFFLF